MPTRRQRTTAEKARAIGLAEVVGIARASRETGIPESSIRTWRERPDFAELRGEKKEQVREDVWAAFQTGVRRVVELIPRTDDLQKVAMATGVLYDKFALMSGEATSRTESKALTDDISDDERQRLRDWIVALPSGSADKPAPV